MVEENMDIASEEAVKNKVLKQLEEEGMLILKADQLNELLAQHKASTEAEAQLRGDMVLLLQKLNPILDLLGKQGGNIAAMVMKVMKQKKELSEIGNYLALYSEKYIPKPIEIKETIPSA